MNQEDLIEQRKAVCQKFGSDFLDFSEIDRIGVSRNLKSGEYPIHGLRNPPTENVSGWYIWVGENSDDPDFFAPIHAVHISSWRPEIEKYLGLGPGWRFLIAPGYEDVWFDEGLLNSE